MIRLRAPLTIGAMIALVALGILALTLSFSAPNAGDMNPVSNFIFLCAPMFMSIVGGLLALRRPDNWAGWTLLVVGSSATIDSVSKSTLQHALVHDVWAVPLASWSAWLDNWLWTIQLAGVLIIILKFAGGTRHGRRLRIVGWCGLGIVATIWSVAILAPTNESYREFPTPMHVDLPFDTINSIGSVFYLAGTGCFLCAALALLIHARHADGANRAQLRWLLWTFTSVIVGLVASNLVSLATDDLHVGSAFLSDAVDVVSQLTFLTIPLAIYISITRYGLFEIDRVVSRTVSYSVLTLLLTTAYVTIVTSATRLLPDRLGSLPVAAATLAVAAAFVPARRWLVAVIDRRFNRGRFDAERVISAFAERVRHDGANDPSGQSLLLAVHQVFQPSRASVWVLPR